MMKTHPGKVTCHALLRVSLFSMDSVAAYMILLLQKIFLNESFTLKVKMRTSVRNCVSDSELQKSNAYCKIFLWLQNVIISRDLVKYGWGANCDVLVR